MDLETEAIAARMIEEKIRDEWAKIGGTADCRAIVNYREETGDRPVVVRSIKALASQQPDRRLTSSGAHHSHK